MKQNKNKAVFFDRDGTVNVDKKYLFKAADVEFIPGIFELMAEYRQNGYLLFIITNQSGIARGYYSESDFQTLSEWMLGQFNSKGIKISKIYHCPHHPEITGPCQCRKPKPGMILQAIAEFDLDPLKSIVIGDKKSDILAGEKAGIGKNVYIQSLLDSLKK